LILLIHNSFLHTHHRVLHEPNWVSHTPDDKRPQDASKNSNRSSSSSNKGIPQSSPCSPPTPYEKFFLPFEDQSEFFLAATHLSTTNNNKGNNSSSSSNPFPFFSTTAVRSSQESHASESIRTEEFASIVEDFESVYSETDFDEISIERNIYKDDILGLITLEEQMASKSKKKVKTVVYDASSGPAPEGTDSSTTPGAAGPKETVDAQEPDVSPSPTVLDAASVKESSPHYDVVDHVYEGAKSAWAMGKDVSIFHIAVFKPFLGVAEGVATKILSVAAGVDSLDTVDKSIKPHLKGIDHDLVDPAIQKLWSIIGPIIGKGDEVVKGMVNMVKHPLIKNKSEEETAIM
jgi:hypothetical protein